MEAMRQSSSPTEGRSPAIDRILADAIAGGSSALDEFSSKAILAEIGIPVPRGTRIGPRPVRGTCLSGLRPPFVLKALSSEAIHKSDIGAVRLGLADAAAVEVACSDIAHGMETAGKVLTGFLVEEMAAPGVEIVIGGVTDPQLGPMIMVGAGGVFAEILQDVSFRLCPIGRRDAREMIGDLKIFPVLNGARGRPAADMESILDALLALGGAEGFFTLHGDLVAEFDLNPVIARPDGLTAVDARMVLTGGDE